MFKSRSAAAGHDAAPVASLITLSITLWSIRLIKFAS
jgi:hypothetical protein